MTSLTDLGYALTFPEATPWAWHGSLAVKCVGQIALTFGARSELFGRMNLTLFMQHSWMGFFGFFFFFGCFYVVHNRFFVWCGSKLNIFSPRTLDFGQTFAKVIIIVIYLTSKGRLFFWASGKGYRSDVLLNHMGWKSKSHFVLVWSK